MDVDERSSPLFHMLSRSHVTNDVLTIPQIPVQDASKASGCLWAMSKATRGRQLLTVWDMWVVVCAVSMSTMNHAKTKWKKGSDFRFVLVGGVLTSPIGMAKRYVFRLQKKFFAVRVYVVEKANY